MDVRMELARVLITEMGDRQMIVLKEAEGDRSFPVVIGINEALAIRHRLGGHDFPRPLTHDLLANVIAALGADLDRIVIHDLQEHTFIAKLVLRRNGETIEVDSRPSDAIALGSAFETPIYVAEEVLATATRQPETVEEKASLLRERQEMLQAHIGELAERLDDPDFVSRAPDEVVEQLRRQRNEMQAEHDAIERVLKNLE